MHHSRRTRKTASPWRGRLVFCNRVEYLLVIRFQMEEDSVLFVTDHRVKVAIRVRAFRLKYKVMVGEVRHSRPVDRCSRLHKLTSEILHDVDHFLAIGDPAPLDVKGHRGGHGSDG